MAERRSDCPIACALEIVGDRWTLVVLRDLLIREVHYFDDFLQAPERIATNILGDRLRKLESDGLLTRTRDPDDGRRVRYELTERGKSLEPVLLAVTRWGLAHIEGTKLPARLSLPVVAEGEPDRPEKPGAGRGRRRS